MANLVGSTPDPQVPGVLGENTNSTNEAGVGVYGKSAAAGVLGESTTWHGVAGLSKSTTGGAVVYGQGLSGNFGVLGESTTGAGVEGRSQSGMGVFGQSDGVGVLGKSKTWNGVYGESQSTTGGSGVHGKGLSGGFGVLGESTTGAGVEGRSSESGIGIVVRGGRLAGLFFGDVEVTGDIRLQNADCAEDFDIVCIEQVEPGTVMVIDAEGALRPSDRAYDKRVAGVISGAGNYKPGLILDKQESSSNRMPIALMGKVYCKVDASYGAIEVGDLLTTSPTLGHAMKANDPLKASKNRFRTILRRFSDRSDYQELLIPLGVRLSELSNSKFRIAA